MRRWAARTSALVAALAAACTPPPPASEPLPQFSGASESDPGPLGADAAAVRSVVGAFIAAEASGEPADSLLVPGADLIMTGIVAQRPPRLAGLNGPGTAAVETADTWVGGALAYVVVVYRFEARLPELGERARGTFVLEKQRAGWRIRHVHTSMVERWER